MKRMPVVLLLVSGSWLSVVIWGAQILSNVTLRDTPLGVVAEFLDKLPPSLPGSPPYSFSCGLPFAWPGSPCWRRDKSPAAPRTSQVVGRSSDSQESPSRLATLYIESSDSFVASAAASIATGWSEPVPGRELHPLKSSAFHGALLRQ